MERLPYKQKVVSSNLTLGTYLEAIYWRSYFPWKEGYCEFESHLLDTSFHISYALVVQWIGREISSLAMWVRFLPRVLLFTHLKINTMAIILSSLFMFLVGIYIAIKSDSDFEDRVGATLMILGGSIFLVALFNS